MAFLAFSFINASAEVNFKKLIEDYDISDEAKLIEKNHPEEFWKAVIEGNLTLTEFQKDIKQNKTLMRRAKKEYDKIPYFQPKYDERIWEEMQYFCDSLLQQMGIAQLGLNCSLHIICDPEENAYTAVTEDGFAMCITTALFFKKHVAGNINILKAYIAHEFAHGALMHMFRAKYAKSKQKRKQKISGAIASIMEGAAMAAETWSSTQTGIPVDYQFHEQQLDKIEQKMKSEPILFEFDYSRKQEYEADLIGYRFMENLGLGEEFLNGLRILGSQYDYLYSDYSDHPTINSRIQFLKYVKEHPEIRNTANDKAKFRLYGDDFEYDNTFSGE